MDFIEKRKLTCLKKYGVENPMQCAKIREKAANTLKLNYGVNNPSSSKKIQDKKIKSSQTKHGLDHHMKSNVMKEKVKTTNLERYNVTTTLLDEATKQKGIETNIELYGFDNPMKSDLIKEKVNQTNLLKYNQKRYILTDEYSVIQKKNNLIKTVNIYSKKLNIDINSIIVINDNDLKILNYCDKHSEFIISKNNLRNRLLYDVNICTECFPINNHISIGQNEVRSFIENVLKIKTDTIKINNKEIDINLPDYNLGIEYNGLYWHNERYKNKKYHLNKTNDCEKQGIQLLHIFEDEWLNKREIVKSIISSKLNKFENKIFASKCIVKEIKSEIATKFSEINHIQGSVDSFYNFGLFHNNELVSLMSFNKITIEDEYELLRFCTKLNTQVIDGASKLLNYFIKNYQPKTIITFTDRRYSQGNLCLQLGFEFKKNTEPNYWYYGKNELNKYHRFKEDILITNDSNKTKHLKIFDCGNIKFELKI